MGGAVVEQFAFKSDCPADQTVAERYDTIRYDITIQKTRLS
jgi:hypothetical protein